MTGRRAGILLAFTTACISGVSIWVNGHAVTHFTDATVYTTAKDAIAGVLLIVFAVARPTMYTAPLAAPISSRTRWLGLAVVAVIGGSVPFVLFFEGLARAEATQASFIQKTLVDLGGAARRAAAPGEVPPPAHRSRSRCSSRVRHSSCRRSAPSSSAKERR